MEENYVSAKLMIFDCVNASCGDKKVNVWMSQCVRESNEWKFRQKCMKI